MVLIGYLGCDIILVLIIWFIAVTLITAGYAGAMANIVDIAPNFAGQCAHFCEYIYFLIYLQISILFLGPVLAFAQTIHMTASFLSPIAAGLLTQESVSVIFYSITFLYRLLESQNNVMFSTAISRFVEKSICAYCGCILQYVYCLSNIWYGGYTSMELSR